MNESNTPLFTRNQHRLLMALGWTLAIGGLLTLLAGTVWLEQSCRVGSL